MGNTYSNITALLRRLGITANYTGFFQLACAIQLCMAQPERLLMITKWVYPDVAKQYKTSWTAVERNIRTVIGVAWKQERPFLEHLAQRKLPGKPGAAQLMAIIAYWLLTDADDSTPSLMEREGPEFSQAGKSPILPSSI